MCKGHKDARFYRFDFVNVLLNEMMNMHKQIEKDTDSDDNETTMKRLFDGF